jgi:hypothetical protein
MQLWLRNLVFVSVTLIILFSVFTIFNSKILVSPERSSPSDWIKETDIIVQNDKVILNVINPTWAKFTNTNSMDPFIDENSHAIEVLPESPDQINVGDVISYQTNYGVIIHRVIEKGEDDKGMYFYVQGDNTTLRDPFKVRFDDVQGVVVAVIY